MTRKPAAPARLESRGRPARGSTVTFEAARLEGPLLRSAAGPGSGPGAASWWGPGLPAAEYSDWHSGVVRGAWRIEGEPLSEGEGEGLGGAPPAIRRDKPVCRCAL